MTAAEKFRNLLAADDRYEAEAYNFVYEALDWTLKNLVKAEPARERARDEGGKGRGGSQHVTGQELLEGIRRYAIEQFGCLSRTVLENWGVHRTGDFGEIVFNLVQFDLMGKQESDSKADFNDVYEFSDVFDLAPVFCYAPERDEWKAAYVSRANYRR